MDQKELVEQSSRSEYTNTSRLIHSGPCLVYDVNLAGDGANADCQVYDGINASGLLKAHVEALSGTTEPWSPPGGVLFNAGLYIAVNASTSKVTATYHPVSRKDMRL